MTSEDYMNVLIDIKLTCFKFCEINNMHYNMSCMQLKKKDPYNNK